MGFCDCLEVLLRDWQHELGFRSKEEAFQELLQQRVVGASAIRKLRENEKPGKNNSEKLAAWLNQNLKSVEVSPVSLRSETKKKFENHLYSKKVLVEKKMLFGERYDELCRRLPGIYITYRHSFLNGQEAYRELIWVYKEGGGFGFKTWYKMHNDSRPCNNYFKGGIECAGGALIMRGKSGVECGEDNDHRFRDYRMRLDEASLTDSRLDHVWIGSLGGFSRRDQLVEPVTASFIMLKAYEAEDYTEEEIREAATRIVKFGNLDNLDDFQNNPIAMSLLRRFISNKLHNPTTSEIEKAIKSGEKELARILREHFVEPPGETVLGNDTQRFKSTAHHLLDVWDKPEIIVDKADNGNVVSMHTNL